MPTYRSRTEVTAVRWFENGDWPGDDVGAPAMDPVTGADYVRVEGKVVRFYRTPPHVPGFAYAGPETPGGQAHEKCGHLWDNHGWIDQPPKGITVCPGMWVVQMPSRRFFVLSDEHMRQHFEVPV